MKKLALYKDENTIAYTDLGDKNGHPIFIQHGMIASINDIDLFSPLIASGFRVISIARPGYGDSTPFEMKNIGEYGNIVSSLVDDLGLAHFDAIGISSGAPYSYAVGFKCVGKVRNLFILSGTPALYDDNVLSLWPYPVKKDASLPELQKLAHELFFSHLSREEQARADIKDSMMNDCFGVALDLKLRCNDWGFQLADLKLPVYMRHSKSDQAVPLATAEMTCKLIPNGRLEIRESDVHFSQEVLNDFLGRVMEILGHPARSIRS